MESAKVSNRRSRSGCAFLLSLLVTSNAWAFDAVIPNIQSIAAGQQCPEWCWAASVQMVAASKNIKISQATIVQKLYGPSVPCTTAPLSAIQYVIDGSYITESGMEAQLRSYVYLGNSGYFNDLISSIRRGYPFIITLTSPAHAMLAYGIHWNIVGYDYVGNAITQVYAIDYVDPYFTFGSSEYGTIAYAGMANISGAIVVDSFAYPKIEGLLTYPNPISSRAGNTVSARFQSDKKNSFGEANIGIYDSAYRWLRTVKLSENEIRNGLAQFEIKDQSGTTFSPGLYYLVPDFGVSSCKMTVVP